jgi:hypothetical protein
LASPSDVADERDFVARVVQEWNQGMTSTFNKSRRRLHGNISRIIDAMESGKELVGHALRELDDLIRFARKAI